MTLKSKKLIKVASVVMILLLICTFAFFTTSSKDESHDIKSKFAHTFEGFPISTSIEVNRISDDRTVSKALIIQNKPVTLVASQQELSVKNYFLHYIIQWPDQKISDVKLLKKRSDLKVSFSNLPINSKVSMRKNQQQIESPIAVDWAGHLSFNSKNTKQYDEICLLINAAEICHIIGNFIEGTPVEKIEEVLS